MENVLFTRQKHEAEKAGLHYDYRIVVGDKAHSWATKKELPEVGKSIMLWEQPVHTASYALSKKVVIPKGQYGAGITTLNWVKKGKASFEDGKIIVETPEGRFLLKKMPNYQDGSGWLFKNLGKEKMEKKATIADKLFGDSIIGNAIRGHKREDPALVANKKLKKFKQYLDSGGSFKEIDTLSREEWNKKYGINEGAETNKNLLKKADTDKKKHSIIKPIAIGTGVGAGVGAGIGLGAGLVPAALIGALHSDRHAGGKAANKVLRMAAGHAALRGAILGGAAGTGFAIGNHIKNKGLEKKANRYLEKIADITLSGLNTTGMNPQQRSNAFKAHLQQHPEIMQKVHAHIASGSKENLTI